MNAFPQAYPPSTKPSLHTLHTSSQVHITLRQLDCPLGYLLPRTREFYPTACQRIGLALFRVGIPICPQLHLTTVLSHTVGSATPPGHLLNTKA